MKPVFKIEVNTADVSHTIRKRLQSLRIEDNAGFAEDTLELTLNDYDPQLNLPTLGTQLTVYLGYARDDKAEVKYNANIRKVGVFSLNEIEHQGPAPGRLILRCNGTDMSTAFKSPRSRSWDNTNVSQLVTDISNEFGYTPKVDSDLISKTITHISQKNEGTKTFLANLARSYDSIFKVSDGTILYFGKRGLSTTVSGKAYPPVTIDLSRVHTYRNVIQVNSNYTGVKAKWQDTDAAETKYVLQGVGTTPKTLPRTYSTEQDANENALAEFNKLSRKTETMSITLTGDPSIRAEQTINLTGTKAGIATKWLTSKVTHTLDSSGYVTMLDAEIPETRTETKSAKKSDAVEEKKVEVPEPTVFVKDADGNILYSGDGKL